MKMGNAKVKATYKGKEVVGLYTIRKQSKAKFLLKFKDGTEKVITKFELYNDVIVNDNRKRA